MQRSLLLPTGAILLSAAAFAAGRLSHGDATEAQQKTSAGSTRLTGSSTSSGRGFSDSHTSRSSSSTTSRSNSSSGNGKQASGSLQDRLVKLEGIVKNGDAIERNRALLAYIDQLEPGELQGAVDHFRSLGITNERFSEYAMLLTAWAKNDPTSALAYAKANTNGGFANDTILRTWATNDPEAAIAWAKSSHPDDSNNPYFASIIGTLAASDPNRATQLLATMAFGKERGASLDRMMPHILAQGTDATRQWIASLGDPQLQAGAIQRAAGEMSKNDPKGTADWLLSMNDNGATQNISTVMQTWSASDSQSAVGYFQTLPRGEARSSALGGLVNSMTRNDATAAAALIDKYSGDATDDVVYGFVRGTGKNDPALAASYIGKIGDAKQRDDAYNRVLSRWIKNDQASASAWIQANNVPANVQRNLGLIQ